MAADILSKSPDNVAALACKGMADWEGGEPIAPSIEALRRAVSLAPSVSALHHNLGTLLAADGQEQAARDCFAAAIVLRPDDTKAFYSFANNGKFTEETDLVRQMLAIYSSGALSRSAKEFVCFGLAKAYDDIGNYNRAMHFCLEANWLAERRWDVADETRKMTKLTEMADDGRLAKMRGVGHPSPAPLFIVGMPRSGTTLVETILSRHPAVVAGGESNRLMQLEAKLLAGDPSRLPDVSKDVLKVEAERILREMGGSTPKAHCLTDKMPSNAFRLGLIARLFPNARIIYMRRNPVDIGLSNLFMRFNVGNGFSFQQDLLGARIRQTADVMALWKRTLGLKILDVSYERLVAEPEAQSRRIVDFAGLDWDPACLSPEQSQRQVRTASQWQVRQPIHAQSIGKFVRYKEWLTPMIEAMGGWAWIDEETQNAAQ